MPTNIEDLRLYFPSIANRVVEYYDTSPYEVTVILNDGLRFIFDDIDKTIRRLPKDNRNMTEEECKNEFGMRLRKIMCHKGFTQEDLSEATGISQTMLSKYITGNACPSFSKVDRICKALNCSMDKLRYVD